MKDLVLERVFKVWQIVLIGLFIFGLTTAIFNLATGNYCSTASFEF
mgnify:FL=1|jgi:hypothetical protein